MNDNGHLSCCFTGHRNIPEAEYERVSAKLAEVIEELHCRSVTDFYAGGALGFDLIASVTLLNLKNRFPDITLTLCLPCRDHMAKWKEADAKLFCRVMKRADRIRYVSESYTPFCMHARNRYLVDNADICVCYLSRTSGGTYNTVRYAEKKGLSIINLS